MAGLRIERRVLKVADNLPALGRSLANLTDQQVLAGVPAEKTQRDVEDRVIPEITNAALAYIHNFGSPTQNIPPREFMYSGIANVKDEVTVHMSRAAQAALTGDKTLVDRHLHAAGLTAQNGIRRKITTGPFAPLAASTLAARRRRGHTGTRPLIDTGQLRASISYVIRGRK